MSLLFSEPELTKELQYFFGRDYRFRKGQLEIIRAMLDPSRVPLGILPTGGGKSLTFQLPALILSRRYRGLSIIVSPLQALMEDQVISLQLKLEERGRTDYIDRVARLTGDQTLSEQKRVINGIYSGAIDIVYLSPERLRQPTIQRLLKSRSPYLWVLDEAHTLSQWGHDFRPDFLRIVQTIQGSEGNRTTRLGFVTATATRKVIQDLQRQIRTLCPTWNLQRVPNGKLFQWREEIQTHIEPIEKPQSFSPQDITEVRVSARFQRVLEILEECRKNERLGAIENSNSIGSVAIIYTPTRKMAEMYATALQNDNYRAEAFHSRVKSREKKDILQKFKKGELEVVVATNAFGMGIDRAGILTVIHVAPPATPEAYVQEIGRLARNEGERGDAYLFLDELEDFKWIFEQQNKSQISGHSLRRCWDIILDKLNRGQGDAWVSALDFLGILENYDRDILETQTRVAIFYLEQKGLIRHEESYLCILQLTLNQNLPSNRDRNRNSQIILDYLWEIGLRKSMSHHIDIDIKDMALATGINPSQIIIGVRQLVREQVLQWRYEIAFKFTCAKREQLNERIEQYYYSVSILLDWLQKNQALDDNKDIILYKPLEDELCQRCDNFRLRPACRVLEKLKLITNYQENYPINFCWQGEETLFTQWLQRAREEFASKWRQLSLVVEKLIAMFPSRGSVWSQSQLLNIADLEARISGNEFETSSAEEVLEFMQKLQLVSLGRGSIGRETLYHLTRGSSRESSAKQVVILAFLFLVESGLYKLASLLFEDYPREKRSNWSEGVYKPLRDHYKQRNRRIHAMQKIVTRASQSCTLSIFKETETLSIALLWVAFVFEKQARINILRDYFTLSLDDFNSKYFPLEVIKEGFVQPNAYKIIQDLNPIQRQIVKDDISRALLVLAGPGSGKTHTIVRRIAYLILARGVQPEKIVALTYNRTAAAELRKRLYKLLGSQGARVTACTFHSLAKQLTKLTRSDAPNHFSANDYYNWLLEQATEYIKENHPGYSYILVDEYQDIDRLKYQMIKALADLRNVDEDQQQTSFLVAVGDDDQNLYEFQGANIEFIRAFEEDYDIGKKKKIDLIINYRSCPQIINFSNQFITRTIDSENRMKNNLIQPSSERSDSGQVWYVEYRDWYSAAKWVVERIRNIRQQDRSLNLDDIAILAHRWEDLRFVQHLLREENLPYQLYSEHEDLRPSNSFIGQKVIQELQEEIRENPRQIINHPKTHIESIRRKLNYGDWDSAWHSLTYQLTDDCSMTNLDIIYLFESARNYKQDCINLSSFHSAKGTEFKYVFVIEDGIRLNQESPESCARRLYVGFTRAKEELYILVNNVKSCRNSGFTNPSKHPILEINNFAHDLNINIGTCDLQPKPSHITYQAMLEPKDLYLSHPVVIQNQARIEQYARQGGRLFFRNKFFNLENNGCSAISVLSEQGQKETSKYNQGTHKQFAARGHTIFRVERDEQFFIIAGVTTDITHHYIVLPRLEIEEQL